MLESNGASVVAPKFEDFSQNTANGSGSHSKYIRSGRNNPCPVCDRVKDADCSWYPDGRTVMCKSCVDGTGHDESKWHYTGVNELGFQGKFVLKQEREFVKARRPKDRKDYYYPNRDGSSLVRVTRTDDGNGNKKFSQSHWDGSKWLNSNPEHIKRSIPIYRYSDVRAAIGRGELVFVVEGEEAADALWKLGIAATTTIGGSGGYANYGSYLDDFQDARLVLAPDRDANGLKHISNFERDFASQIEGWYLAGTLGLWHKPQDKMDIHDDIRDRHYTKEQILDKVINPNQYRQIFDRADRTTKSAEPAKKEPRQTIADRLLEIGRSATYFHTADKVAYADIWIDGNRHTYAVRSKAFRFWLLGEYFQAEGKAVGSQSFQDALNTLEAIAIFKGETHGVHLRTAEDRGKIYLDLGGADWQAVEIDALGWRVVSAPPVRFWRPESLLSLPPPIAGGSLEELRELLNVDGSAWTLIITFLLFCFCPDKTYPVLALAAHRGSGKTAAAEILKGLIDPGKAPLIKLQGDTHKLAVAASRRLLMVYDNVGHISADQSDDLCRLATGFGYSTRTLHTTDEETTFEFARPQIITAIDALVTRDDLADRVLMVQLPEITEEQRLPQSALNAKVEAARPKILGALLTALSQTLAEIPHTKPDKLPRMADYALFAIASEKALGLNSGEFRKTFDASREQSRQVVIESSPVGEAIVRLMSDRQMWKGTASELLNELERHTDEATYRSRFFPKASNLFKRQLNRLTPDLQALGVWVSEKNIHGTKQLTLEKVVKVSPPSPPSPPQSLQPSHSNNFAGGDQGGDKGGDKSQGGDTIATQLPDRPQNEYICSGGDTFAGGDQGGDEKNLIATRETSSPQAVRRQGGDGGDKHFSCSKQDKEDRSMLKVGDRVLYIGSKSNLKQQYAGTLKIHEIANDTYTCLKSDGSLTSWIEREDLRLSS